MNTASPLPYVSVLYIAGTGRSGSTVADLTLGTLPGFVSVGELAHVWQRGLIDNEPCACGEEFRSCSFWQDVGVEAFAGWDKVDAHRLAQIAHRFYRPLRWPRFARLRPKLRADIREYRRHYRELYLAISRIAQCDVVIDSSKYPGHAILSQDLPDVRRLLLHLVRDARGVAYSRRRNAQLPDSSVRSGLTWLTNNGRFHLPPLRAERALRVRYECFIHAPMSVTQQLMAEYGKDPLDVPEELRARQVTTDGQHAVAGNPVRLARGTQTLTLDDAWVTGMRRHHEAIVVSLAWPLLAAYGYLGSRRPGLAKHSCGRLR